VAAIPGEAAEPPRVGDRRDAERLASSGEVVDVLPDLDP